MAKTKESAAKSGSSVPNPETREERFLAKAAGADVTVPSSPYTRLERFLKAIVDKIGSFVGLPEVTGDDNGKILGVVNGEWDKTDAPTGLPISPEIDGTYYLINRVDTLGSQSYLGWGGIGTIKANFALKVEADEGGSLFYQLVNYLITYASTAGKNKAVLTIPEELLPTWDQFYQATAGCPFVKMSAGDGHSYEFTSIASRITSENRDIVELYAPDSFSSVAGYGIERIGMTPDSLYVIIYNIDAVTAPFPSA